MAEEDKRQMVIRLDERTSNVQKLTNNQLDMVNQLPLANQELNIKDLEIANLISQNDQMRNELRTKKELVEKMTTPNEVIRYFEELMRSPEHQVTPLH